MTAGVFPPEIIAAARASQGRWAIPASVCLAQWALESGWGRSMPPGSNNPFGIKARPGDPGVVAMTDEVIGGRVIRLPQRFLKFTDIAAAFDRHGRLLATGAAYAAARAVRHDPRAFATALQGHYATDPAYAARLIALIDQFDLIRFDRPDARHPAAAVSDSATDRTCSPTQKGYPMLTNKWFQFGLSAVLAVLTGSASLDWSAVLAPTHAAGIATGIAVVKAVLNLLAPGPRVPVQPTGGAIITHKEI